jgi:uncharacterized protein (DUF885 family)
LTPKQVHETGLSEVKRIHGEMDAVIAKTGFKGSFAEFVNFLRTDPRFYTTDPQQLMKETAFVLKKIDGQLPTLFKTLPRMPYGIKPIPDFMAPKTTTAYYERGAGDGTRAAAIASICMTSRAARSMKSKRSHSTKRCRDIISKRQSRWSCRTCLCFAATSG